MRMTIGKKLALNSFIYITLLIIMTIIVFMYNNRVTLNAVNIEKDDLPGAIYSLAMLDEIGDMNSNLLEYLLGEADEKAEFDENYKEFRDFFDKVKPLETSPEDIKKMNEIERLVSAYAVAAKKEVFERYDPETEKWARTRGNVIKHEYGDMLEKILDESKEEEIGAEKRQLKSSTYQNRVWRLPKRRVRCCSGLSRIFRKLPS
ncbi:hypothetical protein QUF72_19655 [Desulfobacterales bacterium HSG2]|nr:hypothetical protein [Desulfobacterales bacterium HSG2]